MSELRKTLCFARELEVGRKTVDFEMGIIGNLPSFLAG